MKQLIHRGVMIPPNYEPHGFHIRIAGNELPLTPKQEEMAVAWVKKLGTDYVKDQRFVSNFFKDFRYALGVRERIPPESFDFSEIQRYVDEDRIAKATLSKEERKRIAQERKAIRMANKEKYGYARVDGVKMENANYVAEPSCIYMGRGSHPMRGRWKEGPGEGDIELNLSPDAPKPPGNWKAVVFEPDAMWVARWRDKLSGKIKYVWLSDSSIIKQKKDIEKFEKARELGRNLKRVQRHILENLDAKDLRRRKTATVCCLIDKFKFRVGDEKDEEEADTVGASTLRPEHISFNGDGKVTFDFIGKDSVRQVIRAELPEQVVENLRELSVNAESALFGGVDSKRVSAFLDEVMTGLSAKVFRTHYASTAVDTKLGRTKVDPEDPEYLKKHVATMANLEAAKVCNHKRTIPKSWEGALHRKRERLEKRKNNARENAEKYRRRMMDQEKRYRKRLTAYEKKLEEQKKKLGGYIEQLKERTEQGRATTGLKKTIASKRRAINAQRERIRKLKKRHIERMKKLKKQMKKRKQSDQAYIEKLQLQVEAQRATRDYNLGTSLKSYIDPRIYCEWGRRLDFGWKLYYPRSLQRRFSWVESPITRG
ncbi:MAG: hypothetical protein ACETVV_03445 [Nitrososphaeria archaeon]